MAGEAYRKSVADFGATGTAVQEAGAGSAPAEFDWSWGTPVPEVDAETFQDVWNSRTYATKEDTQGSLAAPQMAGGTGGGSGGGRLSGGVLGDLSAEQSENARIIIKVGQERGLSRYAQAIAVMTALGESGLRNLGYGDDIHGVTNPDGTPTSSIGMFQEQKWFGSVKDRLDPYQSSNRFYDRLLGVDGWQNLKPTMAAHKAQVNADPNHYTKWWNQAAGILQAAYGG
jgi:hypothetical protein